MKIIDLDLPDLSNHPPPPHVSLEVYEKWVFEWIKCSRHRPMTDEELLADFMRNEGSQTEEWPDFGAANQMAHTNPDSP